MSFRLFIYYCALCGGWSAFVGFWLGLFLSPSTDLGGDGIKGMWLGLTVAGGLGLVDALWNVPLAKVVEIASRLGVGLLVGCVGGLLGGVVGHILYDLTGWTIFYLIGWTLTGLLVGASVGVFEVLSSVVRQQDVAGSMKKLVKGLAGGMLGGMLGGIVSLLLRVVLGAVFPSRDFKQLWTPTGWGFVAVGMCIGLLIGIAQVVLKDAWIRIEKGRRVGREMILTKEVTTLGRAEACDIGLFGDAAIEKLHASILLSGNRYYVEDAGTPGGTFINDERTSGRVALKTGDTIRVGDSVLRFGERAKRSA